MKNLKLVLAAAAVIFLLSACQKTSIPKPEEDGPPLLPPTTDQAVVGEAIKLGVGETTILADGATVMLKEINDSRCKPGVQCIWAGELSPLFVLNTGDKTAEVRLGTVRAKSASSNGYTLNLVGATETVAEFTVSNGADVGESCVAAKGAWSTEWDECTGVDKTWCEANGGRFEDCGSACRHDPKAEFCTMQCVIFCDFGPKEEVKLENLDQPLVGGDRDAHGCIGSAGYSWCEAKAKCLRIWEEACWPEVTDAIKQAFADKYKKPLDQIRVTVGQADDTHSKGGIGFSMNGEFGEGGNFLAVKADGKWKIVFDGNGAVACSTLEPYKFPASMIDGFCTK